MPQPLTFHWKIQGHEAMKRACERATLHGKIAQANLIAGPAHIGKRTLVLEWMQILFCKEVPDQGKVSSSVLPCRQCPSCLRFAQDAHPDVFLLQLNANDRQISIEEIRLLRHRLHLTPRLGLQNVVILDQGDLLTAEASNALLKLLEEPPKTALLFLLTSHPQRLLPTLRSRLRYWSLHLQPLSIGRNLLREQGFDESSAIEWATFAQGRPGLAVRLGSDSQFRKRADELRHGILEILEGDSLTLWKTLPHLLPTSELSNEMRWMMSYIWITLLRDLLRSASGLAPLTHLRFRDRLQDLAPRRSVRMWSQFLESVTSLFEDRPAPPLPLALENAFFSLFPYETIPSSHPT